MEKEKIIDILKQSNWLRILVADDTEENIVAAKKCFEEINFNGDLSVVFVSNGSEAIEILKREETDLVITDLTMEKEKTGLDVIRRALEHKAFGYIATGQNYDHSDNDAHGPNTTVIPTGKSIKGRKNKPEVWKEILNIIIKDSTENQETAQRIKSTKRYWKNVGKGLSSTALELTMQLYQ